MMKCIRALFSLCCPFFVNSLSELVRVGDERDQSVPAKTATRRGGLAHTKRLRAGYRYLLLVVVLGGDMGCSSWLNGLFLFTA